MILVDNLDKNTINKIIVDIYDQIKKLSEDVQTLAEQTDGLTEQISKQANGDN